MRLWRLSRSIPRHPTAFWGSTPCPRSESSSPRFPLTSNVGVTLLGRLAVGTAFRGQHIGEFLSVDALYRVVALSDVVATVGVVVDTLPGSTRFYVRYGFLPLDSRRSCRWTRREACCLPAPRGLRRSTHAERLRMDPAVRSLPDRDTPPGYSIGLAYT